MGDDFLNLCGEVAEFALHLVEDVNDLTGTVTKALADIFDNVDLFFGYFNVCHFSYFLGR